MFFVKMQVFIWKMLIYRFEWFKNEILEWVIKIKNENKMIKNTGAGSDKLQNNPGSFSIHSIDFMSNWMQRVDRKIKSWCKGGKK